jgi:shikimate kinase
MEMKNIVLVGFMGTGKTSTGRLLARRLSRPFIDTDRKIEFETGLMISELFKVYGEQYFRQKEQQVVARVAKYSNAVIATGGGTVLNAENVSKLKQNGLIFTLVAPVEAILERTSRRTETRPLLVGAEAQARIMALLSERENIYHAIADHILDTGNMTPQQVADKIITYLRQGGYLRGRS